MCSGQDQSEQLTFSMIFTKTFHLQSSKSLRFPSSFRRSSSSLAHVAAVDQAPGREICEELLGLGRRGVR